MTRNIALLALLAAFPPLSTDMYLAAIPLLVETWGQSLATVNLTLIGFFVTYCGFLLLYGPFSDRLGRRPPLLFGLGLYILASLLCAISSNIHILIGARILQGAGAASASSIAFAICKDLFDGSLRQRIFLQLGVIVAAAPMLAPVIGGWIIVSLSWRWVFVLQAVLGITATLGVWRMRESLEILTTDKLSRVFTSYARLFHNKQYILLTLALACLGTPFFAFIAVSSDIYIHILGYSERQYGFFFAFNASAFMLAPLVFARIANHFPLTRLLPASYLGMLLSSVPLLLPQIPEPYRLAASMWFLTFSFAFGRPPGNNLILEQVSEDAGAASSFMVFVFFITGAAAMWFISLGWHDAVRILGILGLGSATITLTSWFAINRLLRVKFP